MRQVLARKFGVLLIATLGLSAGCSPRVVVDLDPVVEFGLEEQIVSATDSLARVPIIMNRVSSEVVTVWIKYDGHTDEAGTISFPAGVNAGEFQVNLKGGAHFATSKVISLTMTKSSFSKIGKTRVHRIKVEEI